MAHDLPTAISLRDINWYVWILATTRVSDSHSTQCLALPSSYSTPYPLTLRSFISVNVPTS